MLRSGYTRQILSRDEPLEMEQTMCYVLMLNLLCIYTKGNECITEAILVDLKRNDDFRETHISDVVAICVLPNWRVSAVRKRGNAPAATSL